MKFLLTFSLLGMMFGCQQEDAAGTKGEVNKVASEEDATEDGISVEYRYANYKFIKSGYNNVNAAIRLTIHDDVPVMLELKDLKEGREEREVEEIELNKVDADSSDTVYAFEGQSVLPDEKDNSKDHGGKYTGTATLNDGTVTDDGCCGDMTFVPNIKDDLVFIGKKQDPAAGEAFDEAWWNEVTGDDSDADEECAKYKLEMSDLTYANKNKDPLDDNGDGGKIFTRGRYINYTVTLKCLDNDSVITTGDEASLPVQLASKHDEQDEYNDMEWKAVKKNLSEGVAEYKYKIAKQDSDGNNYPALKNMVYKATVTIDSKAYEVESEKFDINADE